MNSLKRQFNSLKNQLNEVKCELNDLNVENTALQVYEEYKKSLNKINEDFVKIKTAIVVELDRMEIAEEMSQEDIDKLFNEHSTKFLECEKTIRLIRADLQVKIAEKTTGNEDQHQTSRPVQRNNLPKMKLPHFAGDYKDWPTLKEKFIRIVD
jgi:hypothetical protein